MPLWMESGSSTSTNLYHHPFGALSQETSEMFHSKLLADLQGPDDSVKSRGSSEEEFVDEERSLDSKKRKHSLLESRRRSRLRSLFEQIKSLLGVSGDRSSILQEVLCRLRPSNTPTDPPAVPDYRHVVQEAPVAMAVAGLDGRFVDCNVLFEEMTGYSRSQILLTTLFATMAADDVPEFFAAAEKLTSGDLKVYKKLRNCKHSSGKPYSSLCLISLSRNPHTKEPLYFICVGVPSI